MNNSIKEQLQRTFDFLKLELDGSRNLLVKNLDNDLVIVLEYGTKVIDIILLLEPMNNKSKEVLVNG